MDQEPEDDENSASGGSRRTLIVGLALWAGLATIVLCVVAGGAIRMSRDLEATNGRLDEVESAFQDSLPTEGEEQSAEQYFNLLEARLSDAEAASRSANEEVDALRSDVCGGLGSGPLGGCGSGFSSLASRVSDVESCVDSISRALSSNSPYFFC